MKKIIFLTALFSISILFSFSQITSATFGTMKARWLGPGTNSGRITAIDGSNSDGKTIYVGTAGGGVWKTTNAGASFTPVFDKYCQSIGAVAIDQSKPSIVFVGTGESNMRNSVSIGNGLYMTNDGGDNWKKVGLDSTEHIAKIVIDPKNSKNIYVAAPGPLWSDSKNRGLYKSDDGGKSWNKILYINEKAGCADVAVDPENPEIVYASTWEFRRYPYAFNSGGAGSGMWKSTDGGKNWKELKNGLPAKPFGRIAFALAPSSPQNILAIVESASTGLYISSDGGESWKKQSATSNVEARPFYFSVITIDPKDPKRVYRPAYTFSYSVDGGYSFAGASNEGAVPHADMHALWINPNNTNQMYLGTDGGVYYSLDKGVSWLFIQNLPVGQFYHVAFDNAKPYNVMGGLQDNGSWLAPSASASGVSNADWSELYGGDGFWVQPDPAHPGYVYAEAQGGSVSRINAKTAKSVDIQPKQGEGEEKLRYNWNTPIVIGTANKKNLYIASQYLYKSINEGKDWQRISPDLTTNDKNKQKQEESGGLSADVTSAENHCTIFTITESPFDEKIIWVGTDDGNLQYTIDGGKKWINVAKNYEAAGIPHQTWVSSIELSKYDRNTLYVTFDNHMYGDMNTYLAKSSDMGKTWQRIDSKEFTGFAHKIKEDIVNKNLLFLGTEMGLFTSLDGGKNWFRMKNNIPEYALVRDIQINPSTNDLILATHGRGIMILDNISAMRNLTPKIAENNVYTFKNAPIQLTNGYFGNGGHEAQGGWSAGNPASVPPIQYYLKNRLSTDDVTVEIFDNQNKLLQKIPGTKRKGLNEVYWNLRMTPPKVASGGAKIDYSSFVAPMVLPGNYKVKLKVGDREYTESLTLVSDATDKTFTIADRQLQYKVAMNLYHLHEKLATLVDSISKIQAELKVTVNTSSDKKVKEYLTEYNNALETLRATLLATTQLSQFADEERLREKISSVYLAVCNQEAVPSNSQIANVSFLQKEELKAEQKFKTINAQYSTKAREYLHAK
ncbi:MAG: glycosyl hydrolase [Bacteroidetes bacterium]|nr:glycosyl hydrolase [Bacteroidota bacterium]